MKKIGTELEQILKDSGSEGPIKVIITTSEIIDLSNMGIKAIPGLDNLFSASLKPGEILKLAKEKGVLEIEVDSQMKAL